MPLAYTHKISPHPALAEFFACVDNLCSPSALAIRPLPKLSNCALPAIKANDEWLCVGQFGLLKLAVVSGCERIAVHSVTLGEEADQLWRYIVIESLELAHYRVVDGALLLLLLALFVPRPVLQRMTLIEASSRSLWTQRMLGLSRAELRGALDRYRRHFNLPYSQQWSIE